MPAIKAGLFALLKATALVLFSPASQAASDGGALQCGQIVPYQAEYTAFRSGSEVGSATQSLRTLEPGRYQLEFRSSASLFFLSDKRQERSQFAITQGRVLPLDYHFSRSGTGRDKQMRIRFDNQAQRLKMNDDEHRPWDGSLDNLLFRYCFSQRAAAKPIPHQDLSVINSRGDVRHYSLYFEGEEQLRTPFGDIHSHRYRMERESKKRVTYLWLAPELNGVMVRMRQLKSGSEQLDIQLRELTLEHLPTTTP